MELDIIDVSKNDRRPAPARSVPRERRPQQKGQVDRNRGGNPGTGRDPGRSPRRNPQRGQNGNIRRVSDRDLDRNMRRMPECACEEKIGRSQTAAGENPPEKEKKKTEGGRQSGSCFAFNSDYYLTHLRPGEADQRSKGKRCGAEGFSSQQCTA